MAAMITKSDLLAELARMRTQLEPISMQLAGRLAELHALAEAIAGEDVRRDRTNDPTWHRQRVPVPFIARGVGGGARHSIQVKPQIYFRGLYLWIDRESADAFEVSDVYVGKGSQRAECGPSFPAKAFATELAKVRPEEADRLMGAMRWELEQAEPGIIITVDVVNTTKRPADFEAVIWGEAFL